MNGAQMQDFLRAFATLPVANVSDNLERVCGAQGLRPFHRVDYRMVGRALTVRTAPGDNAWIHRALDQITPGDVVVVDGGGYEGRALVGEIMVSIARKRGAAGMVIDGAIRDVADIRSWDFPVFARSAIHLGPYKNGPGALNIPVNVGGMVVSPGDIVLGDDDGVTAFSPQIAASLLDVTLQQQKKEAEILRSIADGTYTGAYAK